MYINYQIGNLIQVMKLMGRSNLKPMCQIGNKWITSFVSEVINANWRRIEDVQRAFPRIEHVENSYFKLTILNTNFYLLIKINFQNQIVLIKEVKSFY